MGAWEPDAVPPFDEPYASTEGRAKFNRHYWLDHWEDFVAFLFDQCFPEPHSTKQVEDCVGWGLETTPQVLIAAAIADEIGRPVDYRPVETDAATRAASLIAELL